MGWQVEVQIVNDLTQAPPPPVLGVLHVVVLC